MPVGTDLDEQTNERSAVPARLHPPIDKQRLISTLAVVGFVAATIWGWGQVDLSVKGLIDGAGDMRRLIARMLPPTFDRFDRTVQLTIQTLWIALIGTSMAVALSLPLSFMAARNTTPHPLVMTIARGIITLTRAVPTLILALIFVRALRIGVLPGVLAIGIHSVGMIAKLFADAIEQIDETPREAVLSTGASKWQAIVTTVIPQVMPSFISTMLYRLDINLRESTILGVVGAGGIGTILQTRLRGLDYDGALGVIVVIFVFILAMELASALVRATLLGGERVLFDGGTGQGQRRGPGLRIYQRMLRSRRRKPADVGFVDVPESTSTGVRISPPWTRQRIQKVIYAATFVAMLAYSFWSIQLSPGRLVGSVDDMWRVMLRLFPPDFTTARESIVDGMVETIAVAFVATFLGALLAFPLGLLAARNVAANKIVYAASRVFLVVLRGLPELIIAVIFVAALGLGPRAGALALVVGTTGFFAKLIADSVEVIDSAPREAVFATGASRVQETFTSVIPQAMPALVANLLYMLDINLRASTVLGIVGGGGIGFLLFNSVKVLQLQTTGAIVLSIFVVVYVVELLAGWIRKQLL